jgi:hypothetical protein
MELAAALCSEGNEGNYTAGVRALFGTTDGDGGKKLQGYLCYDGRRSDMEAVPIPELNEAFVYSFVVQDVTVKAPCSITN